MHPVILFIHGFGSNGFGSKAQAMRRYCEQHDIRFLAPSLPVIPALALQTLEELIEQLSAIIAPQPLMPSPSPLQPLSLPLLSLTLTLWPLLLFLLQPLLTPFHLHQ